MTSRAVDLSAIFAPRGLHVKKRRIFNDIHWFVWQTQARWKSDPNIALQLAKRTASGDDPQNPESGINGRKSESAIADYEPRSGTACPRGTAQHGMSGGVGMAGEGGLRRALENPEASWLSPLRPIPRLSAPCAQSSQIGRRTGIATSPGAALQGNSPCARSVGTQRLRINRCRKE